MLTKILHKYNTLALGRHTYYHLFVEFTFYAYFRNTTSLS